MYCEEAEPFVFGHSVLELNRLFLSSLIFFHSHKKAFFFFFLPFRLWTQSWIALNGKAQMCKMFSWYLVLCWGWVSASASSVPGASAGPALRLPLTILAANMTRLFPSACFL